MKYINIKKEVLIIIGMTIVLTSCTLWYTGILKLMLYGISYVANNTEQFTLENSQIIMDAYEITINLADLDSNIGKELYNDGTNRIYVSWIDNSEAISTGGYRIGFRSVGDYSLNGAILVSGIAQTYVPEEGFSMHMSAKMKASYNGKTYTSNVFGITSLNYKDGDEFSFYLFPRDAYEKGEVTLNEQGEVKVAVSNLCKNIWTKIK